MKITVKNVKMYKSLFSGRTDVYGTYNPHSGKSWKVEAPVTDTVIFNHLTGRKPYGVYLLVKNKIRAIAVDFDTHDQLPPYNFVKQAEHYGLAAYIETSKSKGYHVWIFFDEKGVLAFKARLVVRNILDDIEQPDTEVFPKQDFLDTRAPIGNFINAPLWASLVLKGKTVFVHLRTFKPYSNQWDFLETVKRHSESVLDDIIELNNLSTKQKDEPKRHKPQAKGQNSYSLPPCARIILKNGVSQYQRVSCFRLAVHLKMTGIPEDIAKVVLTVWASKNQPKHGKRTITETEIIEQVSYAYSKNYRGYGCGFSKQSLYNLIHRGTFILGKHYLKPTPKKILFKWSKIRKWMGDDLRPDEDQVSEPDDSTAIYDHSDKPPPSEPFSLIDI